MGRYNDFISKLVDSPELTKNVMVGMRGRRADEDLSTEDAAVFGHLLAAYGIIDEDYLLYAKNWMDEENWRQWFEWLRIISEHPLFPRMAAAAVGNFDKDFEELVSREVLNKKSPVRGVP